MRIAIDGGELEVEMRGRQGAPPVLCWNGANCTLRQWDVVVERLGNDFRFITFDVRGTGRSSTVSGAEWADVDQYTFEQYAKDANVLLDEIGFETVLSWGTAWGSRAALVHASLHPERVSALALFDASVTAADPAAQRDGYRRALERQVAAGIAKFERPDGYNHHLDPTTVSLALAATTKADLPTFVAGLTMPLLVAAGDHDPNLISSRQLVGVVESAELVEMSDVGHGSVLQRPDLTSEIFARFAAAHI